MVFLYYLPLLGIPGLTWLRTDSIDGGNNWAGVLFTCAIYVLIAIGLNVVIGLAGLLDLGYVGFFAIGAYSVALFGSTVAGGQGAAGAFDLAGLGGGLGGLHPDRAGPDDDLGGDPGLADAAAAR